MVILWQLVAATVVNGLKSCPLVGLVQFRLDSPRCWIVSKGPTITRPEDILLGDEGTGVMKLHPGIGIADAVNRACVSVNQTVIVILSVPVRRLSAIDGRHLSDEVINCCFLCPRRLRHREHRGESEDEME